MENDTEAGSSWVANTNFSLDTQNDALLYYLSSLYAVQWIRARLQYEDCKIIPGAFSNFIH